MHCCTAALLATTCYGTVTPESGPWGEVRVNQAMPLGLHLCVLDDIIPDIHGNLHAVPARAGQIRYLVRVFKKTDVFLFLNILNGLFRIPGLKQNAVRIAFLVNIYLF